MILRKLAIYLPIRQLRDCSYRPWLWLIAIAATAFSLRFWQLSRFNTLVFDEVYFVNFAQAYRHGLAPTDAHPPLGKYIIAAGIQLGNWLNATAKTAPEVDIAAFNYRQANALIGSLIPLIVVSIARTLSPATTHQKSDRKQWQFAILSGLFIAIDGLFITESRYALLNSHVVCLGLLSHWLWLKAALTPKLHRPTKILLQIAAGCFLGGAIAVKWNGLGYLLSLIIWEIWRFLDARNHSTKPKDLSLKSLAYLALIAIATYSLIWWPHLHITQENILSIHANLFSFHQQIGASGHAACSKWYSWPLLIRPITYKYIQTGAQAYAVSNLGNPALWLFSSSALILLAVNYALKAKNQLFKTPGHQRSFLAEKTPNSNNTIAPYLLISYFCNWLPWILIQRCTFNYLYMPAAVYSFMTLAWLLSTWLNAPAKITRTAAWLMLSLIAIAFLFWLPLSLGLPLSPEDLQKRWLLKSWM